MDFGTNRYLTRRDRRDETDSSELPVSTSNGTRMAGIHTSGARDVPRQEPQALHQRQMAGRW